MVRREVIGQVMAFTRLSTNPSSARPGEIVLVVAFTDCGFAINYNITVAYAGDAWPVVGLPGWTPGGEGLEGILAPAFQCGRFPQQRGFTAEGFHSRGLEKGGKTRQNKKGKFKLNAPYMRQ